MKKCLWLGIVVTVIIVIGAVMSCSLKSAKREVKSPIRRCCVTDPQSWYSDTIYHPWGR